MKQEQHDKSISVQQIHEIRQNEINKVIYTQVMEQYQVNASIVQLLGFAEAGMTMFDLYRLIFINYGKDNTKFNIHFGDWNGFIRQQLTDPQSKEQEAGPTTEEDQDA